MGKPGEPAPVQVDSQRVVGCAQSVYPHVEFPTSEQERVENVTLANIVFDVRFPSGSLPLGHVSHLVEDEDTLALALGCLRKGGVTGFMIQRVLPSLSWSRLNSS